MWLDSCYQIQGRLVAESFTSRKAIILLLTLWQSETSWSHCGAGTTERGNVGCPGKASIQNQDPRARLMVWKKEGNECNLKKHTAVGAGHGTKAG